MPIIVTASAVGDGSGAFDDATVPALADTPQPGPLQVRIAVRAAGINHTDLLQLKCQSHILQPQLPYTPGLEVAGVVDSAGPGVDPAVVGQRVAALTWGAACAAFVLADVAALCVVPSHWTWEQAAAFPINWLTAYFALVDAARLRAGESVVVTGASGHVGCAAVKLAKAVGAAVFATSRSESNTLALSGNPAVDIAITTAADGPVDIERELSRALKLHGYAKGADVVLDGIGGGVLPACLEAAAPFGRVVTTGFEAGPPANGLSIDAVVLKNLSLLGVNLHEIWISRPSEVTCAYDSLLGLMKTHDLVPDVGVSLPMSASGMRTAIAILQGRDDQDRLGKIVLRSELDDPTTVAAASSGASLKPAERPDPFTPRRGFASCSHGQVHYYVVNGTSRRSQTEESPPPLVLLHMAARSSEEYVDLCAAMRIVCPYRSLIAVDNLGHGLSAKHPDTMSITASAAAVAAVLAQERVEVVDVMGHLTGAFIAMELAISRPAVVRKLILSGLLYLDADGRSMLAASVKAENVTMDRASLTQIWDRLAGMLEGAANMSAVRDLINAGGWDGHGHISMSKYPSVERMPLVRQEALVILGRTYLQRFATLGCLKNHARVVELLPRAKLHMFEDGDVCMLNTHAADMAAAVTAFLDEGDPDAM